MFFKRFNPFTLFFAVIFIFNCMAFSQDIIGTWIKKEMDKKLQEPFRKIYEFTNDKMIIETQGYTNKIKDKKTEETYVIVSKNKDEIQLEVTDTKSNKKRKFSVKIEIGTLLFTDPANQKIRLVKFDRNLDDEYQKFWSDFKKAISKKDKNSLLELVKFPIYFIRTYYETEKSEISENDFFKKNVIYDECSMANFFFENTNGLLKHYRSALKKDLQKLMTISKLAIIENRSVFEDMEIDIELNKNEMCKYEIPIACDYHFCFGKSSGKIKLIEFLYEFWGD